jgi:hypothetical protein
MKRMNIGMLWSMGLHPKFRSRRKLPPPPPIEKKKKRGLTHFTSSENLSVKNSPYKISPDSAILAAVKPVSFKKTQCHQFRGINSPPFRITHFHPPHSQKALTLGPL